MASSQSQYHDVYDAELEWNASVHGMNTTRTQSNDSSFDFSDHMQYFLPVQDAAFSKEVPVGSRNPSHFTFVEEAAQLYLPPSLEGRTYEHHSPVSFTDPGSVPMTQAGSESGSQVGNRSMSRRQGPKSISDRSSPYPTSGRSQSKKKTVAITVEAHLRDEEGTTNPEAAPVSASVEVKRFTKAWFQAYCPILGNVLDETRLIYADYLSSIDMYPDSETALQQGGIALKRAVAKSRQPLETSCEDDTGSISLSPNSQRIVELITGSAALFRNTAKRKAAIIVECGKYYLIGLGKDSKDQISLNIKDLMDAWKFAHCFDDPASVRMFQHPALEELVKRLFFQSKNGTPIAIQNNWTIIPLGAYAVALTALWAILEQYASGRRSEGHKFEDSPHYHQVYDGFADALEQFEQLEISGKAFQKRRKHLAKSYSALCRSRARPFVQGSPVVFHVQEGEQAALSQIQAGWALGASTPSSKARRARQGFQPGQGQGTSEDLEDL